nr:PREDICTED: proteinase-activated receptor 3-like [Latimeria chalumnae]|eukprot:XP_006010011.1 PREDICTED: proteinase-activated receptor 3-like [Latimeria chalumnae]
MHSTVSIEKLFQPLKPNTNTVSHLSFPLDYTTDENSTVAETDNLIIPRAFPGFKDKNISTNLNVNDTTAAYFSGRISTVLIPMIFTITLLVGLPANGLALWVLSTKTNKLPSYIFLINLTVADFIFTFTLPFKISYHFLGNDWRLGEYACRALVAAFYGNMYCSVLLLMCISIDRYIALVHPFSSRSLRSKTLAHMICTVVWIIVILGMVPFTLTPQSYLIMEHGFTTCHDVLPKDTPLGNYFVCLVMLGFFLPFAVIVLCYICVLKELLLHHQQYNRAIRLTALVLLNFIICFTPCNVILLIHSLELYIDSIDSYIVYTVCLALSSLNTCIDPFIYYYVSEDFRHRVINVLGFSKDRKTISGTENKDKSSQTLLRTNTPSV